MKPLKRLWHKIDSAVRGVSSAKFWKTFNLYSMYFWIALIPVSFIFGWVKSSTFISLLSLIALVLASQASWQGSRAEEKEDDEK